MTKNNKPAEGAEDAVYQCRLPLSRKTITMVADALRGHLRAIGSWWRKLPPGRIAVIVLAVLRHDQRLADLAGGNGVSASTIRRWVLEVIELLAARAPRLNRALNKISAAAPTWCWTAPSCAPPAGPGPTTGAITRGNTRSTGCCSSR